MRSQFPTTRYHRDGRHVFVNSHEEIRNLGDEWRDVPTSHLSEEEYAEKYGEPEEPKGRWADSDPEPDEEEPVESAEPAAAPERICKRCGKPGHNVRTCKAKV